MTIVQLSQAGHFDTAVARAERHRGSPPAPGSGTDMMWSYIDGSALRRDDLEASTRRYAQARAAADGLGDVSNVAWFDYHLAINQLVGRNNAEAAKALVDVLPGLLDRGDPLAVALAFEDLGAALARDGAPHYAVTAFAVGETERAKRKLEAYDIYVRRRHRLLERLEAELGVDGYGAAWAEGATLSIDEAVRYAASFVQPRAG